MMKKYLIAMVVMMTVVSCSRNIPENTLVAILYEMYMTDAVTSAKAIANEDSVRIYEPIVQKYGYHLEDVNRTILNYAVSDGKLDSVFNKLARRIDAEKAIYQPLARIEKLSANLYIGTDSLAVNSSVHSKRSIDLTLDEKGVYDISAACMFFPDDSTRNPRMSVWLESSSRDSAQWQEIALIKDTVFNDYSFRIEFEDTKFNRLRGYWLNYDEIPPKKLPDPTSLVKDSKKKTTKKTAKPEAEIKRYQHFTIYKMLIKYNFEASDSLINKKVQKDSLNVEIQKDSLLNGKVQKDSLPVNVEPKIKNELLKIKDDKLPELKIESK